MYVDLWACLYVLIHVQQISTCISMAYTYMHVVREWVDRDLRMHVYRDVNVLDVYM